MAHNNIEDILDHLRRIKGGEDLNREDIEEIEILEMMLRLLKTLIKHHSVLLPHSLVKVTKLTQLIREKLHSVFEGNTGEFETKLNMERLVLQLLEFIEGDYSSLRYNYELNDSCLLEYTDCVSTNLNDVLIYQKQVVESKPSLLSEQRPELKRYLKQAKIVQKKMDFLRYLYAKEINGYVDHEKLEGLETRIRFMADNVGEHCLDFWVCVVDEDTDSDSDEDDPHGFVISTPPYLLCLIVLVELEMKTIFHGELNASRFSQSKTFKNKKLPKGFSYHLRSLLVALRKNKLVNFPDDVFARNIDVAIELLGFLADVPNHVISGKLLNEVLAKVGALVGDVLCVIKKLPPNSIIKDDISKISLCSIQILEKTENLKEQVLERYYKSFRFTPSKFPTVCGLSFLDSFLRKLNEMLKSETTLGFMMNPQVGILEGGLSSLTCVFRDAAKVRDEHEVLKDLQRRTINLACEAEISIDSILAQYNVLWHLFCAFPVILKDIKCINAEVTKMWSKNLAFKSYSEVKPSRHLPIQHRNPMDDDNDEVVGFEDDQQAMIQHLIRRKDELDVLPIIGMAGKGKTTFARKLYNDCLIVSHFDFRAWCCVTRTSNRQELLQVIFSQVSGSKDKIKKVDELADKLRKMLSRKRYLIVLDDMWDIESWDDLKLSFPNGKNGSRIVVTTRLEKVGEYVKQCTDPYSLPFLTPDESCKLLQKKVFQKEGCPPELYDLSLEVAERCNGLPLVVVLVAGIIRKNKMKNSWWDEVKNALYFYTGHESEEYIRLTMQFSYDNLPEYLRPCLLYMGMFPEDERIPVSKLISLWIAEGFVQDAESGRLEEAAEGYLMDLVSSNMVMVSRRYDGKVKYCQVHDVVHHFCLEKSREEKFMLVVKGKSQPLDWKETRVRFDGDDELTEFDCPKTGNPFHQQLRSLVMTTQGVFIKRNPFRGVSKLILLKVLDLSCYGSSATLSSATFHPLIHLKYLSACVSKFSFHPEAHLRYLETLIVDCEFESLLSPAILWKMEKLRHVEINASVDFGNTKQQIFEDSSKLENLRTLRGIAFLADDVDSMDMLLQRCPNLKDLEISIDSDYTQICTSSPRLESLTQLQSLDLSFYRGIILSELHLPSSLKKLALKEHDIISAASLIGGLPSLEYLQLTDFSTYKSEEWCLGDVTFDKLKLLKLVGLNISRWDASEASFSRLETLVIKECRRLKEIPLSFADIQTLKRIKLIWCENKPLEASAVRIKEEAEANAGCHRLDLTVK